MLLTSKRHIGVKRSSVFPDGCSMTKLLLAFAARKSLGQVHGQTRLVCSLKHCLNLHLRHVAQHLLHGRCERHLDEVENPEVRCDECDSSLLRG